MIKISLFLLLFVIDTFALSVSSNDNYKVYENSKYTIIYTDDFKNEALFIKENLDDFLKFNDKSFGYTFDEPIKIVLISNNIQIANAFSTQIPYNLGIYFSGGSGMNDYFSTKSWLITLLTHEMVHNYQINAKKSEISKTLHKYLGNNYMPVWLSIVPFFTLPNLMLPTFILEGDAVLNESLYNNGGRLYSGEHNAMKNSLLFDGKIDATTLINDHLDFPYTTEKYIVGGFYMQYLATKFGIDKVNRFFYEHSIHSINPFLLNSTFLDVFKIGFEDSIVEFVEYEKEKYKNYKELKDGKILAKSKSNIYLSKIDNKIYYITSDLTTSKVLNIYNIDTKINKVKNTSLSSGKVFLKNNRFYTSTDNFISSTLYKQGLFDENKYILEETIGKNVKDIYQDKIAYVDIKNSFLNTKLYIDDQFYAEVSSDAIFDKSGNIYYFKQNNSIRELYKNKNKVFEIDGYYGKVVDVIDDKIYFITNTKNGSSLYKYENKNIYLLNQNDNIIDAKMINQNEALVVTITSNEYETQTIKVEDISVEKINVPFDLAFEDGFEYKVPDEKYDINSKQYSEIKNLEFSMLTPSYGSTEDGSTFMLNAMFLDPIMFNMLNIYRYDDSLNLVTGLNYIHERYIPFAIDIYEINREKDEELLYPKDRGYGGSFEVYGPLIKKGNHLLEVNIKQFIDDENENKNPSMLSFNYKYEKNMPLEFESYLKSDLNFLYKYDRDDNTIGLNYKFNKHLFYETYFNTQIKALHSDTKTLDEQRGVEVTNTIIESLKDNSTLLIESSDYDFYIKEAYKISAGASSTINLSGYLYWLPISVRRESIFYKYNQYNLKNTLDETTTINEQIVGLTIDMLFLHKLPIPITIKYIKNDYFENEEQVKVTLGVEF